MGAFRNMKHGPGVPAPISHAPVSVVHLRLHLFHIPTLSGGVSYEHADKRRVGGYGEGSRARTKVCL